VISKTRLKEGEPTMGLVEGIRFNLQGLVFGLKKPRLFFWGMLRFVVVILMTLIISGFILIYHQEILDLVWDQPQSKWLLWLWYVVSWLLTLILIGLSAIFSYLLAQIVFAVYVMDHMSQITEQLQTGTVKASPQGSFWGHFIYLLKQEIPRAILPLGLIFMITLIGWLTPIGSIIAMASSAVAAAFLAWDNTDLVPARRMQPFGERFKLFRRNFFFHLGFGALFLVPFLNILLLSFAPVGATLYYLDRFGQTPDSQAA
jgi:CysZ protein